MEQRSTGWYLWTQAIRAQFSGRKRVRGSLSVFAAEYRSLNLLAQPEMMATLHSAWKAMQPGGKTFQVESICLVLKAIYLSIYAIPDGSSMAKGHNFLEMRLSKVTLCATLKDVYVY
ncbi:hypothetical protein ACLUEY_15250 [Vreelandella aquamarina]